MGSKSLGLVASRPFSSVPGIVVCFFLFNAFPFLKVKMTPGLGTGDSGLLTFIASSGLRDLSRAPHGDRELDIPVGLFLRNDRLLSMTM